MIKTAPCKGCEVRSIGCHAKCQAYKDWYEEVQKIHEAKNSTKDIDEFIHTQSHRRHINPHRGKRV